MLGRTRLYRAGSRVRREGAEEALSCDSLGYVEQKKKAAVAGTQGGSGGGGGCGVRGGSG